MKEALVQVFTWTLAAFLGLAFWLGAIDITKYVAAVIG